LQLQLAAPVYAERRAAERAALEYRLEGVAPTTPE
jgi:hypothetical protein